VLDGGPDSFFVSLVLSPETSETAISWAVVLDPKR